MQLTSKKSITDIFGHTWVYSESKNGLEGDKLTDKSTVLYLHGNFGSRRWFIRALDLTGYHTIAPDILNFGDSDRMHRWGIEAYGEAVINFADAMELNGFHLVGHSMGGAIAMEIACSVPKRIKSLVLIDSSPLQGLKISQDRYEIIKAYKDDRSLLKKAIASVVPTLNDPLLLDQLTDDAQLMLDEAYIGHAQVLGSADFRGRAQHYSGPVLGIVGELDAIVSVEDCQRLVDAFHGEIKIFKNCGHSPQLEASEQFLSVLRVFLDRII